MIASSATLLIDVIHRYIIRFLPLFSYSLVSRIYRTSILEMSIINGKLLLPFKIAKVDIVSRKTS